MGDVWVARNEATQAEVAVKTLVKSERTTIHDERFRREARLAATMSHRNVVRIFDLVDEADGTLGLVMELLRGGTLEACIRERGPLPAMHAVGVAVPILSALHHVHQKGIVHRDVKPANIFFAVEPDGHVIPKILDFGIAKLPAAGSALTMDGSVLGTPHYMSPEQIRGQEDLDGRSDMFSLAVVLYEMLTGVRVFQRDSAAASLAAVLEHEVDPDPRIEPKLWVALSRALAKRPYERYATCGELADALRAAVDATDDELQHAVQELRPKTDAIPETGAASYEFAASSKAKKKSSKRGTYLWAGVAAASATIVTVTTTVAIMRSNGPPSAEQRTRPSASVASVPSVEPPSQPTGRDAIPPPPPPSSVAVGAATTTGAVELDDPPVSRPVSAPSRPIAASGGGSRNAKPASPAVTTAAKGGGGKRDPATKPDF
jgi:serine/threonine-protein kinase